MATPRTRAEPRTGILLVDKPAGLTSHDAVARVRRAFGQREVGHAGTLDPAATGLLVMALGDATRLLRFVEAAEKAYEGTITLGRATNTFDAEGETTERVEAPRTLDPARLEAARASLSGVITQTVPAFSAVKIDGVRAYARARRGEEVEAPRRQVEVHELRLTRIVPPELDFEAVVSKGTYLRSLAVDFGRALGLPAHLSRLRRTRIGGFSVDGARGIDALTDAPLLPAEIAVAALPALALDETGVAHVAHGRPLRAHLVREAAARAGTVALEPGRYLRLLGPDARVVAVGELAAPLEALAEQEPALRYACVLVRPPAPGSSR